MNATQREIAAVLNIINSVEAEKETPYARLCEKCEHQKGTAENWCDLFLFPPNRICLRHTDLEDLRALLSREL